MKTKSVDIVFEKEARSTSFVFTAARKRQTGEKVQYTSQWEPSPGETVHALIAEFDESREPNRHRVLLVAKTAQEIEAEREFALFNWSNFEETKFRYPLSDKIRLGVPVRFLRASVPWL